MSLKTIFDTMKTDESSLTRAIDTYLAGIANVADENRKIDVNAPSQIGKCLRSRYYARMGEPSDNSITTRAQRIFDNGSHVHLRIQGYLRECGLLVMDELPVYNAEYNIQGHTDGLYVITPYSGTQTVSSIKLADEVGVMELKSINRA